VGGDIVHRLTFISPRKVEVFHLRALQLDYAAYNYEELHTVNNITYDTCQNPATQVGLFANLDEVEIYLPESIAFYYALYHLHCLFAQLIVDLPAPALEWWEKYQEELSADHTERFSTADQAYLEVLRGIKHLLTPRGSNLSNVGLPDPRQRMNELDIE